MEQKFINEKEVAAITGLSLPTLRVWRAKQKGFAFVKMGKSVRYLESDILAFMEANRKEVVK